MIVFVSAMLILNLAPVIFYMVKQIKLLMVKYLRIISRWLNKTLLADSFNEPKSSLDLI